MVTPEDDQLLWVEALRRAAQTGAMLCTEMPSGPHVPAEAIRALLVDSALEPDPLGLRIEGATITGTLDLSNAKLPCPLTIRKSIFENIPSFASATLVGLDLAGSHAPGVNLDHATVAGDVTLSGLISLGGIYAPNIQIGGKFTLDDATLTAPSENALNIEGATIKGGAFLHNLHTVGAIHALHAHISVQLTLTGAHLENPNGNALDLDNATINGFALLDDMVVAGAVCARGATIDGQLNLTATHLSAPGRCSLSVDLAIITGVVLLNGLEATGAVSAVGVQISGHLSLAKARLTHSSSKSAALILNLATITGGAFLPELHVKGAVMAAGVHIGGHLTLTRAQLTSPHGAALILDRALIIGGVFLQRTVVTGTIVATDAQIGCALDLTGACLAVPEGDTLNLDRASITGDVFLKLTSRGEVRAVGTQIGGKLDFTDAKLEQANQDCAQDGMTDSADVLPPGVVEDWGALALNTYIKDELELIRSRIAHPSGTALNLDEAVVTGDTLLNGLNVTGTNPPDGRISARDALFKKKLSFDNAIVNDVDLSSVEVEDLVLTTGTIRGKLELKDAEIHHLDVGAKKSAELPPLASAQGWSVGHLRGCLLSDRRAVRTWLETIPLADTSGKKGFSSQPWKELATVYEQSGQPEDARWLLRKASGHVTRAAPVSSKLIRWPYAAVVGYGYSPLLVVPWLIGLLVLSWALASSFEGQFIPTSISVATIEIPATADQQAQTIEVTARTATPAGYLAFNPLIYAVDTAIPAAASGQTDAWRVNESNPWLLGALVAIRGLAWILAVLLLAGFTGILRRD